MLLDPLGRFGTGLAPSLVWRDRDEKAAALRRYEPKPALLVLGSSRVMKLRPACLQELTGLRAFNFGVSAARAEDELAIFRFALAAGSPLQRLLIGVDPEAFDDEELAQLLSASRELRGHAGRLVPPFWTTLGSDLASQAVLAAAGRSAWALATGQAEPARLKSFDPDGFIRYLRWEGELAAGTLAWEEQLASSVTTLKNRHRGFARLDPHRLGAFRELLEAARERGIRVDAYVPPLHPALLQALRRVDAFRERRAETERLLSGLDAEGLLAYHELGSLAAFGGDPRQFFDGEHMSEANAARLLRRLYGRETGCAVQ